MRAQLRDGIPNLGRVAGQLGDGDQPTRATIHHVAARPVVPHRAISRVDRRGIHAFRVHIKRRGQDHLAHFHDRDHNGKKGAYRAALDWYHQALRILPPPLSTSSRDVRSKTGHVGVSLLRLVRRNGSVYLAYRAVWPKEHGKYKKRAFSLKKYGKRVAFQLAVRAREDGVRRLAKSLRDELDRELVRRVARGRLKNPRSSTA